MQKKCLHAASRFWVGLLCFGLAAWSAPPPSTKDSLLTGFEHPPPQARLRCYWWWLNGNTDAATITRDLEAMKAKGYGGAILIDADGAAQAGNEPVPAGPRYGSPAWQKLYLHALSEAARLGLQISLTIQSGWNLGGPTVKPEDSAKVLTFTRVDLHGPTSFEARLDVPPEKEGFYRDIAVLAYPLHRGFELPGVGNGRHPIRLLAKKAVFEEAGFSVPDSRPLLEDDASLPGEEDTLLGEVQDISAKLSPSGELKWQVPAGSWEILRAGYTSSGARVSTASGAWQGLVIDYLDKTAFTNYWNGAITPLMTIARAYLGKSLNYLVTDSWEVGGTNWTARFREEFMGRRHYDPVHYLPIVAGRIVEDRETSNRFLNDFRRTIGDLVISQQYKAFAEAAGRYGIGIHPESGGPHGAPIDALETLGVSTFPQTEFWAQSKEHRTSDRDRFFIKEASSAAHIYGKTIVAGEGMTSIGPQWEESIGTDLKPTFDQALCAGLNLLFWHTFTSSPARLGLPGQEYFAGSHLNPNVTWFKYADSFLAYISRSQFLMQQGLPVADVLYYYGPQVPNFVAVKSTDPAHVLPHYDYDVVDDDVLVHRLAVREGKLILPDGVSYRILVMPDQPSMSMEALEAVHKLLAAGATIAGKRPLKMIGLQNGIARDVEFDALANEIWGDCDGWKVKSHGIGKGSVYCGADSLDLLKEKKIPGDLDWDQGEGTDKLDFAHRRASSVDIYFVRNGAAVPVETTFTFRSEGAPELWNPIDGKIVLDPIASTTEDHRTRVPLRLEPYGSIFVVFERALNAHLVRLTQNGHSVFQASEQNASLSVRQSGDGSLTVTSPAAGHFDAVDEAGQQGAVDAARPETQPITGPWTLQFSPGWGAPASLELPALASWTTSQQAGIRYYSGTVKYTKSFQFASDMLTGHERVLIDLGEVHELAKVELNGHDLGVQWKAPFVVDVTGAVKPGVNQLVLEVTNLWPNRVIGDQLLPVSKRFTHTNIRKFTAESPLLLSGLMGPVSLVVERENQIVFAAGSRRN